MHQFEEMRNLILNQPTIYTKIGMSVIATAIISYLKFRPLVLIVFTVYATWVYRTFYSNYKLNISQDLVVRCKDVYNNAKDLRKNKPHIFCGFVSSVLFLVAVIGHVIEGTYILLICLIAAVLITSKYEVKIIKELGIQSKQQQHNDESGLNYEDFVPKIDEANKEILNKLADHGDDGEVQQPSMINLNDDNQSDNELLPSVDTSRIPDIDTKAAVLTSSAEYRRKHFSNTSSESSDSDDSITQGLDLKNIPVIATIEPQTSTINLIERPSYPSSTTNKTKTSQQVRSKAFDSEDEISDFEFLDKDDLTK